MNQTDNIKRLLHIRDVCTSMCLTTPDIKYYDVLPKYINERKYQIGIEVGVAFGGHCEHILSQCPALTSLIGVDPYQWYGVEFSGIQNQADLDDMYEIAKDISVKDKRFILFRVPANLFFSEFSFQSDFVFIDGNHEYQYVQKDIENAFGLIKNGGMLSGHDYNNFPGVTQAVDEFAKMIGKEIIKEAGSIWIINL